MHYASGSEKILETRSVVTCSTTLSKRSSRTSASMAAAKEQATAEAECTCAYYVKNETEMKVEKVCMEGSFTAVYLPHVDFINLKWKRKQAVNRKLSMECAT